MDLSHLDKKYFIDSHVYNCPFCKRNNVSYSLYNHFVFDWTNSKKCYCYLVICSSCGKTSLHWSWRELRKNEYINDFQSHYILTFSDELDLDREIFYSRPTSFFTLDERIPSMIRELIFEAEQSRQANLLIGSSACLRKAIYELLAQEKVTVRDEKKGHTKYRESIEALKLKFPQVSEDLFTTLANVQELASDHLHEESWEAWDSTKLRFLIELVKTTLEEMYVIPDERKKKLNALGQLKSLFEKNKTSKDSDKK